MRSRDSIFRTCLRGIYSCSWKRSQDSKTKCVYCWFSFLSLVSILTLGWMYICFVAYNDHDDVNREAFTSLRVWVNWYMIVIILSAVLATYCLLLLVLSLVHISIKEPLALHWLHKVLLFVGLVMVGLGVGGMSFRWTEEWSSIYLSLQATAPFLHLGAIVALTIISWLVFQSYYRAQRTVSKIFIIGVFMAILVVVFLSPLLIRSPCLTDTLPPKPSLVGHRGAPVLAPENTIMSFNNSVECGVVAFETDVQLSKDMVPFLMHDNRSKFLARTTNVDIVFPNRMYNTSSDFTWEELQTLNAGEWFVKTNPFWSVSFISEKDKALAREQRVPSLEQLLGIAKDYNISLIFDFKNKDDDCNSTVMTILKSGISQNLIWWLPSKCRQDVKKQAPGFRQVYSNNSSMVNDSGRFLNVKYNAISTEDISNFRSYNVTVNLWVVNERWLFSLLWCAGASSVTTNTCHLLKDMSQPDWHLAPHVYRIIWITADVVSLLVMIILFFVQGKARNQIFVLESERTVPLLNF
ncbi:glycerophosphoinositol inositolphosphodiesterase GDPD2 [Ictalurus furcatus]|uniref:glycerophosphoinositol inositolphosphodiesterase GDPD2 n=1 Tax=Ictalurus furcatus TaxID=66913 RepID=UPI002350C9CC|nr:glycerophosphoinositol inositolphosphodiesterase GDPD2 [Ictalurus furcatus]XP_053486975.1 glycerophosphoinositol inositolphosphodiesterase GDPD2 [Ictalurus furcatus]